MGLILRFSSINPDSLRRVRRAVNPPQQYSKARQTAVLAPVANWLGALGN